MIEISASVLSAKDIDSSKLFLDLETANIDYFHIDVMDGKFVEKNTSETMKEYTNTISLVSNIGLDVHLMVENPDLYVEEYLPYRPRFITFHIEAVQRVEKESSNNIDKLIEKIKNAGSMVGVAIKPDTDIEVIKPYLNKIHMILVMTVEPGKGGQKLIPSTIDKVKEVKDYIDNHFLDTLIEVDGGINDITSKDVIDAGADILVVGSYLISANNYRDVVSKLKTNEKEG